MTIHFTIFLSNMYSNNLAILFIFRLLACKYRFTRNLSSPYQTLRRKNGMQYRSRCNMPNSFGNALLFIYIYKGRLLKILANIKFLFCKEIYMKYLILYYKTLYNAIVYIFQFVDDFDDLKLRPSVLYMVSRHVIVSKCIAIHIVSQF